MGNKDFVSRPNLPFLWQINTDVKVYYQHKFAITKNKKDEFTRI